MLDKVPTYAVCTFLKTRKVGSCSVHYAVLNFSENGLGYSGKTVLTAYITLSRAV